MAGWSPFLDMGPAQPPNATSTDEAQQQPLTTFPKGNTTNYDTNPELSTMPIDWTQGGALLPDLSGAGLPFGDNQFDLPEEHQYGVNNAFSSTPMMDDFSCMDQLNESAWFSENHQADVQPGVTTPWTSAPFGMDQSGPADTFNQPMPWMSPTWATPFSSLDMQASSNQLSDADVGGASILVEAG